MHPQIRSFQPDDLPAARALWERTPGVGLSAADEPDALMRFLQRNPGLSFVAVSAHDIVGTLLCGHDGRRGLIHHLVVSQDCRRQGLGRALLHEGLAALHAAGIDKCHLLVFRDNEPGLAFWRKASAVERVELALLSIATAHAAG